MSNTVQDMFAGTSDPHTSEPQMDPTPDPKPAEIVAPVNPVSGEPTPASPPPSAEGAGSPPVEPQTAQPLAAPAFSPEQLEQIAQTTIAAQQKAQQEANQQAVASRPTPGLTNEQRQDLFRPVRVTTELFQAINGFAPENDTQIQALQTFANSISENALRMAMYYTTQKLDETNDSFTTQLSPLVQQQQAASAAAQEQRFVTGFPDLAEHRDLLLELRDAAISRKLKFNTEQEAFNFIANNARNILAKVRGTAGTPPGAAAPVGTAQTPRYSMPQTSMGGATGPSTTQGQAQKSTVEKLYN